MSGEEDYWMDVSKTTKENRYSSLRNTLLVSMIIVPAIPFFCIVAIGYYYFITSLESENIYRLTRIVEDHRDMIDSFLRERLSDVQFIQQTYSSNQLSDPKTLDEVFECLQKKSSAFTDIGIFNEQGIHEVYHGPFELEGKDYKDERWFKYVLDNGSYISDVFLGYRKSPHFVVASSRNEDGKTWVIRATIDTSLFSEVVETIRVGKTGEAYLLNREGMFQTQRRSGGKLMEKDADLANPPAVHPGVETFVDKDAHGVPYLYATTWLKNKAWLLVVRQEKAEAYRSLHRVSLLGIAVIILGGICIICVAFYVTNLIIRRMHQTESEKEELGKQLVVAGRLAEIGEMSAGFAHEINNPLQIMRAEQTLIDTILQEIQDRGEIKPSPDLDEIKDSMHQIRLQIERCAEVTQGLLKFARHKESHEQIVSLQQIVPEVLRLVRRKAQVEGVNVQVEIAEDIPYVSVDAAHLQQVLVNLFNNAIDAIVEQHGSSGGEMLVKAGLAEDGQVSIAVRDNGCGISPENLEKIFTPFFTTKPVGKGTGLGLSICFGIVSGMGGTMEVTSRVGNGTTFTIYLKQA